VHALVPGAGPSLDGTDWQVAGHPQRKKPWLVDVQVLSATFQKYFLRGLKSLVRRGKLKLEGEWSWLKDDARLEQWCELLEQTDWNTYIEGPPHGQSKPAHVLKYLTRYLTGGPISDDRLISATDDQIEFWARSKTKRRRNGKRRRNRYEPKTLAAHEFVRRWSLHILPKGFTRTRHFGGYHPSKRDAYLQRCRELNPQASEPEQSQAECEPASERACPHCGSGLLELISSQRRPSWQQVFTRDIYRWPDLYTPLLHYLQRGPPATR